MSEELKIQYKPLGRSGKVHVSVALDSKVLFSDKFDVANAEGRTGFLKLLAADHPGLCQATVAARLNEIAAELIEKRMEADDEASTGKDCELIAAIAQDPDSVELFHSTSVTDMETYVTVSSENGLETWPTKSSGFAVWLRHAFYRKYRRAPASQSFTDAMNLIECLALFDGPEHKVHLRLARVGDEIWLDLADKERRAVRITAYGWEVVAGRDVTVRFLRRPGMLDLPVPERGGHIDELRPFVNVRDDEQWHLLAGALPALLRPEGPYPILTFTGQQGSAKTSTSKKVRLLIDPARTGVRRLPREERDLMIAASNAHMLTFDNLSYIAPSISDALCMLSTGGGFGARSLFTDGDEKIIDARRPICLNGIEDVASKADILDRCVVFDLPPIPEEKRREEAALDREFELARPRILGALLDAVSTALRRHDSIVLSRRPRMIDFAKWCTAAEAAFGWSPETFLGAYMRNRADAQAIALEATSIGRPLVTFMRGQELWQGIAEDLLAELDRIASDAVKKRNDWPTSGRGMAGALKRLAPALPAFGLVVEFGTRATSHDRDRLLTIRQVATQPSRSSESSDGPDRASDDLDDVDDLVAALRGDEVASGSFSELFENVLPAEQVATRSSGSSEPSDEDGHGRPASDDVDDVDDCVATLAADDIAERRDFDPERTSKDDRPPGQVGIRSSTSSEPSGERALFEDESYGTAWGH